MIYPNNNPVVKVSTYDKYQKLTLISNDQKNVTVSYEDIINNNQTPMTTRVKEINDSSCSMKYKYAYDDDKNQTDLVVSINDNEYQRNRRISDDINHYILNDDITDILYVVNHNSRYVLGTNYYQALVDCNDFVDLSSKTWSEISEYGFNYEYFNSGSIKSKKSNRIKYNYAFTNNCTVYTDKEYDYTSDELPNEITYSVHSDYKQNETDEGFICDNANLVYNCGYDSNRNIISVTRSGQRYNESPTDSAKLSKTGLNTDTYSYEYDEVTNYLTGETNPNGDVFIYEYSEDGSLDKVTKNGTLIKEFTTSNGILTRVVKNGTTYNIGTDQLGNVTSINNENPNSFDNISITYDDKIRMSSYSYQALEDNALVNYEIIYYYNYEGIRYKKQIKKNNNIIKTINYYLDGTKILGEDWITPSENLRRIRYYYDADGITGIDFDGLKCNYIKDILGNVSMVMYQGKILGEYKYDAWGNTTIVPYGTLNSNEELILNSNPFRYKGYYYDEETQLFYCNSRYYSPELCRFISPDSIEYLDPSSINGLNLYCYCMNNPIMYADPSGHFAISALIIGAIIGAAIGFGGTVLADYVDDGQIFNGSISAGSYIANTLVGGLVGGLTGGIGSSSFTFTYPTLQFAQMAGANGLTFGAVSIGTATATISGTSVVTALGLAGITVMGVKIGKSGGYRIDHHYPNDHDPAHVHISGDDGTTKVDINGNPIQGKRPMTPGERKAFWNLIEKIIEALKPYM